MMLKYLIFIVLHNSANSYFVIDAVDRACDMFPVVVNTWGFTQATEKAWEVVYLKNKSAVDAIEAGCSVCEKLQCDGTVGYGGSPDENGETTLDAMIMDGETMNMGAVGALRRVKSAISVARRVMDYTSHSMLVGDQATHFAISMGFKEETLQTDTSHAIWKKWKDHSCQPNFWMNVSPDPKSSCGPYKPDAEKCVLEKTTKKSMFSEKNHDTIGMVAIDFKGRIAAGTSTNGARHKIPGRVGDSPIPGAGAYADGKVGAAAATGDGDVMMRFLPSLLAVEEMRKGESPTAAGEYALRRILAYYPDFVGGIVVVRKDGEYGAACHGLLSFPFSVCSNGSNRAAIHTVSCIR